MDYVSILGNFGWGGIILIAVLLIFTGRLVPRSVMDAVTTQAGKEADQWRTAYEKSEAARVEAQQLLAKSIEATQITARLVREFNAVAGGEDHP